MPLMVRQVYDRLLAEFGPQQWWPARTPFEVLVGAVLTQNTSWKNVAKAIEALREAGVLDAAAMHRLPLDELAELIRSSGYYRLKARRLRNVLDFLWERYDGSLSAMFATELSELRRQLLGINGIGPETADSILLYAGGLPTFVVDAYTYRIFSRHGWVPLETDYHELKDHFESQLESDAAMFNEYHALLVRVGHHFCSRKPNCDGCPLADMLPEGGPVMPDE